MAKKIKRCEWCTESEIYQQYHDTEWGVPSYDDHHLFEMLMLEGAQAGLSWITVLKKREGYRKAYDNFDAVKMARYTQKKIDRLLQNPDIIRNKLKVGSAVINARAYLKVQQEFGSFSAYIWQFVNAKVITNRWKTLGDIPTSTPESNAMSKDMKKRGFKFVGSTICYAYMQSVGMVNDHTVDCFRYKECKKY
ncbi:DNA-3-methyladenine glycosylase [hydrothermal vent metagenome]|uniref:DNA-3-methyladenine glycosylase n=1 Tax=hydrothermal vent metagenome TaxID=652676 RepID=A0A3B0XZ01_9ZZZZ